MAFQIADLYATIRADDAQLRGSLPNIRRKLDQVHASMQRVAYVARRMFLAISGVLALSVKMASDAEEAHNKFMVVFGNEQLAVTKWAADYGKAVGRAKVDMEAWLAGTQDILVPLGIARHEATGLSKAIVKLGMDIASFSNRADAEVIHNLQSALTGQTRAVLQYGIVVNEAAVKQELLRMGIKQSYADVDNQVKVMARLNVIMAASKDAQGDLMRTQNSFENRLKALTGTWKDFMASLGTAFIPIAGSVVTKLREILTEFGAWLTMNRDLAMTIGLVTLGVTGLLAVLPLLITSLTIIATHPVVAVLSIIVGLLSQAAIKTWLLKSAMEATFATDAMEMDAKKLEDTLKDLRDEKKKLDETYWLNLPPDQREGVKVGERSPKEAATEKQSRQWNTWPMPQQGAEPGWKTWEKIEAIEKKIAILDQQKAANADTALKTAEARKAIEKEIAEALAKGEADAAERMRKAAIAARALHEEEKRHAAVIAKTFGESTFADEMRALAEKLDKKPSGTPGIMGFDQLARRIQEAAFSKDKEQREKELADATKANTRQMRILTSAENDLMEAIIDVSGGLLGGTLVG